MRCRETIAFFLFLVLAGCTSAFDRRMLREGDLIFQETQSDQATALLAATGSAWTHVGVFFR